MKRRFFAFTIVLVLIFTVSCAQQKRTQKPIGSAQSSVSQMGTIEKIKITADNVDVRSGCSGTNPVIQTTGKNNTLDVLSQVSDWYAVKLPNNQIGFVPKGQCKAIAAENKKPNTSNTNTGTASQTTPGTASGSTVPKTPSAQTNSSSLTTQEQQMITLVNQARAQNNVAPLKVDMELTNVARIKAQDMIDNNYFSHNSPKYGSPFDMMKSFGISYVEAGENIAGNQSVQSAQNALMNSPGHRQNILNPNYTHIGIGIKKGGPYGNMFSQMFVSRPK